MDELVTSVMQTPAHCIGMDATLPDVRREFAEHRLSWAPVVDGDGTVLGVIADADLQHWRGRDFDAAHAWQACRWRPICVSPVDSVRDVAQRMLDRHVHHVVVMDGDAIVGVVSSLDFVRRFVEQARAPLLGT